MGMVPKAGGYKRLRLVSFGSITSFERTEPLSFPLPLPERIQRKVVPSISLRRSIPFHQKASKWIQVGSYLKTDCWIYYVCVFGVYGERHEIFLSGKSSNSQNNWRLSWDISHIFLFARIVKSAFSFKFKAYLWFLKWITRAIHFSYQAVSDNWKIWPFEFWIIGCLYHKASQCCIDS